VDWNRVEGNWKQVKGKVKEQWGKLTDDDLDVVAGKRDQLEAKFKSDTATQRIKPRKRSMTGTTISVGEIESPAPQAGLFTWSLRRVSFDQGCRCRRARFDVGIVVCNRSRYKTSAAENMGALIVRQTLRKNERDRYFAA
jgi:uncharacterized protein YjbJ (UPF0337 family)